MPLRATGRSVVGPELKRAPDGTWFCRPYLGTDARTGRRIRPYRSFPGMDRAEAEAACREWLSRIAPAASMGASPTLASMLSSYIWDPSRRLSAATRATYESCLVNYIEPTIGSIDYAELTPFDVRGAYRRLLTAGGLTGKPIEGSTLRKVHALLKGAYSDWQRWLGRNPMFDVPAPAAARPQPFALDPADQEALTRVLLAAMSDRSCTGGNIARRTTAFAAYLALNQGLRVGEACAIRRCDWRRQTHDLRVCGTVVERPHLARQPYPKRGSSGNVALAKSVEEQLGRHLAWQDGWLNGDARELACPVVTYGAKGTMARPSTLSRRFSSLAREAGMPEGTSFHSLRHTHATWLLMHGCDMRTIQERLRHSDVATTLRFYSSVMPGRDSGAAELFSESMKEDTDS